MDRPKILLLGNSLHTSWLFTKLSEMDFADIEQRVLDDMLITGTGFKHILFDDHHGPKITNIRVCDVYDWTVTPADHPTRKSEPKGPRGKWGKLK